MKKPSDLSIGQRLAISFAVKGALLVLLIMASRHWTHQIASAKNEQDLVVAPHVAAIDQLEKTILLTAIQARNYLLMRDGDKFLMYGLAEGQAKEALQTLSSVPRDQAGDQLFNLILPLFNQFFKTTRTMVEQAKGGADIRELEASLASNRSQLLSAVANYKVLQSKRASAAQQATMGAVNRMYRSTMGLGGLVLVLLAITAYVTAKSVRDPAQALLKASRRLATGDYAAAITLSSAGQTHRRDELAELSHYFSQMALDLKAREERLQASAALSAVAASSFEIDHLCNKSLDLILDYLGLEIAALYLADADGRLHRRFAQGLPSGEEILEEGEGIPGRAVKGGRVITVTDIPSDSPFTIRLGVDHLPPRVVVAVPLLFLDQQVGGALVVGGLRPLESSAIEFLKQSTAELAMSIQNAMGREQINVLAIELQKRNETLQAQYEEIQAQQEELQAQHEELQTQNEELQVQGEELQSQDDELRRTVDHLTVSEERYRGLFTHLSEGFALYEMLFNEAGQAENYRFLVVNHAFEEATGYSAEQVIGRTIREIEPDVRGALIERYAEVLRTGLPTRFQDFNASHGRYYEVIAFRVTDREFATLSLDVTDQKKAEEILRDADRNKNEFLAVLSHELRNPLGPIRNSVYIFERAEPGSEQAKRALAVIDRQVNQLARLVGDLLDVTRISRGKVQLQRVRLELGKLVKQAVEDQMDELADAGVELKVEVAGEAVVDGDPARLSQILGNLLQNAAKFTPRGGRVFVLMSTVGKMVQICVRDSGDGMNKNTLSHIFEPFMQANVTLARTNGGLGLGLALVKGLVELHGGSVCAFSEGIGKGSEFIVQLPIAAKLQENTDLVPPLQGEGRKQRILVVEDNVDAAESLKEALGFDGHEVEVAYNGTDGLRMARTSRPDVLLCDIGLPDMDGYRVAKSIRSDPSLTDVFMVALSGYALPEDLDKAIQAGFDKHLAKPPCLEQLKQLIMHKRSQAIEVTNLEPVAGPISS